LQKKYFCYILLSVNNLNHLFKAENPLPGNSRKIRFFSLEMKK